MSTLDAQPIKAIQLINCCYKMGTLTLFNQLNATFSAGITAIVGANGTGKSTLLSLISGICQPDSGQVLINGQALYQPKASAIQSQIGFVPSQPFLYPHLTVLENLAWVATLKKCSQQDFQARISHVLRQCDLFDHQNILFGKLSDGLKKRAMIASSLLSQSSILILDEPCATLDPYQRQNLWALFKQLRAEGQLILFTSHHVEEITPLCNELYLLDHGQLQPLSSVTLSQTTLEAQPA